MNYTDHDIEMAKRLLRACKDDLCFHVPVSVTRQDIERLHDLKLFDTSLGKPIIALCTMETLERIDQDIREQRAHFDYQFTMPARVVFVEAIFNECMQVPVLPETGDHSVPMLWLAMSILSVAGIVLLQKKAYGR